MRTFIVFAVCMAVAYASHNKTTATTVENAPIVDIKENEAGRIINGQQALPGQIPWQVGIFYSLNGKANFCGGALISPEWVLTAAHCVFNANSFKVILGATRAYDNENGKIEVGVKSALYHPDYNNPSALNNDVALIRLERAVQYTDRIQPIGLARSNEYLQPNTQVFVSGWGKTSDQQNSIVNELNYVQLTTISNQQCRSVFVPELIRDSVVCCDGSQIKSTCSGDSGGPLVAYYGNNVYKHVGVVSFVSSTGCAKGYPSGFARTSSFIDFINLNTGLNFP